MYILPTNNKVTFPLTELAFCEKSSSSQDSFESRIFCDFDSTQESETQRQSRLAQQAKEAQRKRDITRRASQLQGRIAQLRSKIMANHSDKTAQAELSMAKTQLYWVLNPL